MSILFSLLAFLVAISILIAVHEFGHFWVARRLGVKVLRYSIGFGKPLYRRRLRADDTEFVIAALPLGGYVKMLDEREGPVPEAELPRAFNRQSVWRRFAIVLAGPAFNFLFAILAYWLMFVIGVTGVKPVIGEVTPGSPAALAGLQPNEEIVAVGGRATPVWDVVIQELVSGIVDGRRLVLTVRTPEGITDDVQLDLREVDGQLEPGELFRLVGFRPWQPPIEPVVGQVVPDSPAFAAGLQKTDRILAADEQPIEDWQALVDYVQARPDQDIRLTIERDGQRLERILHTQAKEHAGRTIGWMGIGPAAVSLPESMRTEYRYGPLSAIGKALSKTASDTVLTLKMFGKIVTGEASLRNLSGPINIAVYAGVSAAAGFSRFMEFLAIVSLGLGIINLFPIPVLDGGHLMFYLVEMVTRRPVSEAVLDFATRIGLAILLALMLFVFYNDIARLLQP